MVEIRFHGRGGQGNVAAAYLLAAAMVRTGRYAQAFPTFGAERRGAPVAAFVRIADRPLRRRCQVRKPCIAVVLDPLLATAPATLAGLPAGGALLTNTGRRPRAVHGEGLPAHVAALPATGIAEELLGRPIPNGPLLGALLSLTGLAPLETLAAAFAERFAPAVAERNRDAAARGAAAVAAGSWREVIDAPGD